MRGTGHPRRKVLGAGLGVAALAGCGLLDDGGPAPPSAPDPLQPLLDEAFALADACDRTAAAQPALAVRLAPLAADHRAHAAELARLMGVALPSTAVAPGAAPSGSVGPGVTYTLAGLLQAERAAQKTAVAACGKAPAERAALVGSIAAGRATHVEALR
jgi:hypothetical protein